MKGYIDINKALAFDFIARLLFPGVAAPAPAEVVRAVRKLRPGTPQPRAVPFGGRKRYGSAS